ncbi:alpha/beta hydrolase [Aliiglaciecola litoralis]|uniref:Alpha/beta hydrolase n=1 Tax=Aliiglaciecola litoralis TaxID=582857 RepID=A0ABP3WVT6_9ALTE
MHHSRMFCIAICVVLTLTGTLGCQPSSQQANNSDASDVVNDTSVQNDKADVQNQQSPTPSTTSTAQANVHILPVEFKVPGLDRTRKVRLYLPPDYDNDTDYYPVLYMHDGQNLFDDATSFVGEWRVDEALNQLAKQHNFKLIVVGIDNGGDKRIVELGPYDHAEYGRSESKAYLNLIIDVIKPYIDTHYRTKADVTNTGIMGSSMGGLFSHFAIYTRPDVFSKAGIYSPSFWYSEQVFALTQENPLPKSAKLDFLVGTKEGDGMVADTNKMVRLIQSQQHPAKHLRSEVVVDAEHNESFWASRFAQSVLWLFQ